MAFNPSNWSTVSSSGSRPVRTVGGSLVGSPALFNYISNVDAQAAIGAANYFAKQAYLLSVGDQIYTVDSGNNPLTYLVTAVTVGPTGNTVTLVNAAPAAGNVVGPLVATDNALVRFDGATGELIQNGVILESDLGDLTAVRTIANGAGTALLPSYTFTGDLDTGMWHSGANNVDFSSNGLRALNIGGAPGVVTIFGDNATASGSLLLENENNNHYIGLTVENALAATQLYTLPSDSPAFDGQSMTSTTAGIMSWANPQLDLWFRETGTPVPMDSNEYFLANRAAGDIVFEMPVAAAIGDVFQVVGMQAAHGWVIQMAPLQTAIRLDGAAGNTTTVGGTITWNAANNEHYSSCLLVCAVANTTFIQIGGVGNPIFA